MAVIQDLVLTFCPTMHGVQQKKLKLSMPVLEASNKRQPYLLCRIFCTDSRLFTDFSLYFSVKRIIALLRIFFIIIERTVFFSLFL